MPKDNNAGGVAADAAACHEHNHVTTTQGHEYVMARLSASEAEVRVRVQEHRLSSTALKYSHHLNLTRLILLNHL